jgi:hypothetical protein
MTGKSTGLKTGHYKRKAEAGGVRPPRPNAIQRRTG